MGPRGHENGLRNPQDTKRWTAESRRPKHEGSCGMRGGRVGASEDELRDSEDLKINFGIQKDSRRHGTTRI